MFSIKTIRKEYNLFTPSPQHTAQIITYFMATVVISSAVAFAIFLSTPLVSIALGAFVFRELDDEPLGAH